MADPHAQLKGPLHFPKDHTGGSRENNSVQILSSHGSKMQQNDSASKRLRIQAIQKKFTIQK